MLFIRKTKYKDVPAVELKNEKYKIIVLPEDGAKIVSFVTVDDGKEYFYQNQSEKYLRIREKDDYEQGECSGFDDMFPTINSIIVNKGLRKGMLYNDHGEVCRLPFSCEIIQNGVILKTESKRLAYSYTKKITENENGDFTVFYDIKNCLKDDFQILWATHCMVKAYEGGKIVVPFSNDTNADLMFDKKGEFGKSGERVKLSYQMLHSKKFCKDANNYKYYLADEICDGYLGYQFDDKTFMLRFDKDKLPYIGIWVNDGSFKQIQCVGLEVCTVGYDDIYYAEKYGRKSIIREESEFSFRLTLSVE